MHNLDALFRSNNIRCIFCSKKLDSAFLNTPLVATESITKTKAIEIKILKYPIRGVHRQYCFDFDSHLSNRFLSIAEW